MSSCTDPNATSSSTAGNGSDAEKFLTDAEKRLLDLNVKAGRAEWVKSTFVNDDTESLAAEANEVLIGATTELAEASRRYESAELSAASKRKLKLLKLALTLPAPRDPTERAELTRIAASMEGDYGKGKYCPDGDKGKCLSLPELEQIIGNSRDPEELKKAWLGWHQIAIPIRKDYTRFRCRDGTSVATG
jgi:peptidyl-dipeptidase A